MILNGLIILGLVLPGLWLMRPSSNDYEQYRTGHALLTTDPEAATAYFEEIVKETGDMKALSGMARGDWMADRVSDAEQAARFIKSRSPKRLNPR